MVIQVILLICWKKDRNSRDWLLSPKRIDK